MKFLGGHGEISPKTCLLQKGTVRNADSATSRVSDCRNSQIINHLEPFDGPSESCERCCLKRYS
jgi:hypothetical protein